MTTPIDVAYVDIVARTKEFRREIKDLIDDEVKELEKGTNDALDEIDAHFKKTAKDARSAFKDIDRAAVDLADSLDDVGSVFDVIDQHVVKLSRDVDGDFNRSFRRFREIWEDLDRRNVAVEFLKRLGAGVGNLTDAVQNSAKVIGSGFINGLTSIPPLLVPILIALPPLIGLLTTLGAVVSDAAGVFALLPAGLAVLAAVIAPLVIGFNGFGDALGAVMEKDPEKLKEALKGLAPAARSVVLEFKRLQPIFTQLGDVVQQALFAPLVGDLTMLVQAVRGPLATGLANVASALGGILSDVVEVLASPEGVSTLAAVFSATVDILNIMRPVLKDVLGSMLSLIRESLPFVKLFAEGFATALKHFSDFLSEATKSDDFKNFMSSAVSSLRFIGDLLESVIKFFGALFTPETVAGGQMVLALLTEMFNRFTAFLSTPAGKRFLEDLVILAVAATGALTGMLEIFGFLFASITLFIGEVVRLFTGAGDIIEEWKTRTVNATDGIVDAVKSVPERLTALGTNFLNAGKHLIESFIGGFRSAGNFINDVAGDIVGGIKKGLNKFIGTINLGIANLDALLPFSLARIPSLASGGIVGARSGGVLAQIAEGGEDEVVSPLSDLKALIADAASGTVVTFGPGSINVNFNGAAPTEGEAHAAGQAVGNGIIAALTRRNIRTQLRTV